MSYIYKDFERRAASVQESSYSINLIFMSLRSKLFFRCSLNSFFLAPLPTDQLSESVIQLN